MFFKEMFDIDDVVMANLSNERFLLQSTSSIVASIDWVVDRRFIWSYSVGRNPYRANIGWGIILEAPVETR